MSTGVTIIEYDPRPGPRFGWRRDGETLTLTVPPPPPWRSLPRAAVPLLVVTPFGALGGLTCLTCVTAGEEVRLYAAPLIGVATLAVWGVALLAFLHRLRNARRPTVVRVTRDELDVSSPSLPGGGRRAWAAGQVLDVTSFRAGAVPAFQQYLNLCVTTRDEGRVVVRVPWPRDEPMVQVEDNLRDVLGLSGVVDVSPARGAWIEGLGG